MARQVLLHWALRGRSKRNGEVKVGIFKEMIVYPLLIAFPAAWMNQMSMWDICLSTSSPSYVSHLYICSQLVTALTTIASRLCVDVGLAGLTKGDCLKLLLHISCPGLHMCTLIDREGMYMGRLGQAYSWISWIWSEGTIRTIQLDDTPLGRAR